MNFYASYEASATCTKNPEKLCATLPLYKSSPVWYNSIRKREGKPQKQTHGRKGKMKVIEHLATIERQYANWGRHCEQVLAYTLTGKIRKADHIPFDKDSDIPEFNMSVKSHRFTLASGNINYGDTLEEKIADFARRVHSTQFAYVTDDMTAYIMDLDEFVLFISTFGYLTKESERNGGKLKVQCKHESKALIQWLKDRVAA